MIYVFDTSSLVVINHYYPHAFPTFWARLDELVNQGIITSTREVYNELQNFTDRPNTLAWAKNNKALFEIPTPDELRFVAQILAIPRFQALIGEKNRLKGTPVADPFVVATARVRGAVVVTQEVEKQNAAKIPNVCKHFGIGCINLAGFMQGQGWTF